MSELSNDFNTNNKKQQNLLCGLESLLENPFGSINNRRSLRRNKSFQRTSYGQPQELLNDSQEILIPIKLTEKNTNRTSNRTKQKKPKEDFTELVEKAKESIKKPPIESIKENKKEVTSIKNIRGDQSKQVHPTKYSSASGKVKVNDQKKVLNQNKTGSLHLSSRYSSFGSLRDYERKSYEIDQTADQVILRNKTLETSEPDLSNIQLNSSNSVDPKLPLQQFKTERRSFAENVSKELNQKLRDLFQKQQSNRQNSSLNIPEKTKSNINIQSRSNSLPRSLMNMDKNQKLSGNLKKNKSTSTNKNEPKIQSSKLISEKDDNVRTLDNEDYARFVENYERNLELKMTSNTSTSTSTNIPVSILKQPKNSISNSVNNNNINKKKQPSVIMNLDGREIVVIDSDDEISESEVKVILNPRKEVDLADLLGTNWPTTAGDAALVLNTNDKNNVAGNTTAIGSSSTTSNNYKNDNIRNKSANPLAHIQNSKINTSNQQKKKLHQQQHIEKENNVEPAVVKTREKKTRSIEPIYDNTNQTTNLQPSGQTTQLTASSSVDENDIPPSPLAEIPGSGGLGVGSMVEVSTDVCEDLYGVIRWIGCPQGSLKNSIMVGVELEDDPGEKPLTLTDGTHNGIRLFKCPQSRGLFIHPSQCSNDRRFLEIDVPNNNNNPRTIGAASPPSVTSGSTSSKKSLDTKMFGQVECPVVPGSISPLKIFSTSDLEEICGKFKGIQGHHNSCYLDATLFAMFMFTSVFDSLLFRPSESEDIPHYEEVQKVLREEIVNPLRKNNFVRADRVMKLRQLLDKLSSVSGLTSEEKDPEEFLNSLLAQILRADPFLKLSSGQDTFFYQLFVEKDERLSFPSVQQLFEQSFLASDIKLKEVPSCLIIQMPRFGKNFKMYPRILPSQVLDVTDIIADSPRQCSVCGKLAEFECRDCFGILQCGVDLESTAFCSKCLETVHLHSKRANHKPKEISVPQDFKIMAEHLTVPRIFMELFAVVCIETSHYVAFVKSGTGSDSPWVFFDSMADRAGEQNGYNIPELITVPDLPQWLSEEGSRTINDAADKNLPEHAKRLFCDAYMCLYQSPDVMMYR